MGSQQSQSTGPGRGPVRLALRHYLRELSRRRRLSVPALTLPALGNIGITYVAPLVVAKLVGRISEDGAIGIREALPYVGVFVGVGVLVASQSSPCEPLATSFEGALAWTAGSSPANAETTVMAEIAAASTRATRTSRRPIRFIAT